MAYVPAPANNPVDFSQYISTATDQAYQNWQRQKEQMDWAKAQFAKNAGVSDQVVSRALDTSKNFADWSQADRALYEGTYVPAMKQQMEYAQQYTTPERMAANRAGAMAQQNIAFDANADAAKRQLQSIGVDPSSGSFAGLQAGLAAARAKNAAAAGTTSDRQTEMLGQQYLANAIQTGAVLPGQVVNEAGAGIAAGNQAVNTGLATTASGSATMGTPLQWNQQGNTMIAEWPKWMDEATKLGMAQNKQYSDANFEQAKLDAASSSGVGAAVGAGAGLLGGVLKQTGGLGSLGDMFGGGGNSGNLSTSLSNPAANAAANTWGSVAAARGGMIHRPQRLPHFGKGGMIERFALGGFAGQPGGDLVGGGMGGGSGGIGFNPMSYITDIANIGTEIGGGDQGETESPQTPMDPLSSVWDTAYGMPREKYDEGERIGSSVGRPIGRAIGDYFTGGIGSGAFAEGFGRIGGSVGAGVQGHFGEAANDLLQGTPLSFIKFQEGGEAPDTMSNMVQPEQSPSGGAETDDVHALLNEGEFVVPKDVASWLGEKFLQNLINKARTEAAGPKAEPEEAQAPQAMALSPPSFASEGARAGA